MATEDSEMGRPLRGELFSSDEVCIVHVTQRCVRRAFLAGEDPVTGESFEFRRDWIRRRLELLSAVHGIDVLSYAILSNHIHVILRTRPDVVETWSDKEVAENWLKVYPGRRIDEHLGDPTREEVERLANDSERLLEIRRRLSDVSWFMKSLSEPIARLANKQDGCTGRFWEGRFRAQRIVDEAGLLACSMYVDLNPVRAAMAQTPEQSRYTSAYDRIKAGKGEEQVSAASEAAPAVSAKGSSALRAGKTIPADDARNRLANRKAEPAGTSKCQQHIVRDAWLAPLELAERGSPGPQTSRSGVRASDNGFLPLSLSDYLKLLDWTGRQGRRDKRGKIPSGLAPILQRIGIDSSMWCDLVWNFKRYFGRSRAAGRPDSMKQDAADHGHRWVHGQRSVAECFA